MMRNLSQNYWWSPQVDVLTDRLVEDRRFIQVVSGPWQVGKTTMAWQAAEICAAPSHYAAADAPVFRGASRIDQQWNWGRLLARDNPGSGAALLLDEIQKVSGWSELVKRL